MNKSLFKGSGIYSSKKMYSRFSNRYDIEGGGVLIKYSKYHDLRTSADDTSQRMLNALLPGTIVPIHHHEDTTETVICLCGQLDEIIYDEHIAEDGQVVYKECQRIRLSPSQGDYGCQVSKGAWHTVEVLEPSVIFEAKDGAYK